MLGIKVRSPFPYPPLPPVEGCVMAVQRHALAAHKTDARRWPIKDHGFLYKKKIDPQNPRPPTYLGAGMY